MGLFINNNKKYINVIKVDFEYTSTVLARLVINVVLFRISHIAWLCWQPIRAPLPTPINKSIMIMQVETCFDFVRSIGTNYNHIGWFKQPPTIQRKVSSFKEKVSSDSDIMIVCSYRSYKVKTCLNLYYHNRFINWHKKEKRGFIFIKRLSNLTTYKLKSSYGTAFLYTSSGTVGFCRKWTWRRSN